MRPLTLDEIRAAIGGVCGMGVSPMRTTGVPPVCVEGVSPSSERVAGILPACGEGVSPSSLPFLSSSLAQQQQDAGGTPATHEGETPSTHMGETPSPHVVTSISTDSRRVKPGDLFVAISGEKFDAHKFLGDVFHAGAAGAVVNRNGNIDPRVLAEHASRMIVVDDTVAALGKLGAYHRDKVKARVIAVTGSNGKTTTKRMIQHILAKHLKGTCSPKSFNNNIGVPLTLLGVGEDDDYVICEVGTNAPGEIAGLSAICRPDVAEIVSVGETHLEKLGSVELVAVEKASMLGHLRPGGCAIVWADSPPLTEALKRHDCRKVRFGLADGADLRITDFSGQSDHVSFRINGGVPVRLPQPGRHNASNALAAIAAAMQMGLSAEQAAADLSDFGGVEMRLESTRIGPVRVINDAYNANPSSMLAAADVLARQDGARRVMVVGDMLELGEDSRRLHERTGRDIAKLGGTCSMDVPPMSSPFPAVSSSSEKQEQQQKQPDMGKMPMLQRIDLLIGVGEMGRYIASGAGDAGLVSQAFDTLEEAAAALPSLVRPGDVILIKGSRGMAMERLIPPLRKALEKE